MPRRRIRVHYEQLSQFARGRIIGLKEVVGQIGERLAILIEAMWPLDDTDQNGWGALAYLSIMVVAAALGTQ
ncbi:hypothetical protein TNCV_2800831 [Trichonephila clavipes]|nr:hypothetical protein TNCV_2800831 [Trichonephila clavipes]